MDKKTESISLDLLEGHDDGVYPWAEDTIRDWAEFVKREGNEFANRALEGAKLEWPPERLALDISTKCNLRCPMCSSNGDAEGRDIYTKTRVEWQEIADFIIRSGGAKTISIGSLGESFLKKDTLLFMEAVKDHVRDFAFGTNATAVDFDYIQEVAKYNVSSIRISCDAGDPISYPIWRKGATYETFRDNCREFARLFGDKVALHSVFFRENLESLMTVAEFTKDLDLGLVEVHALRRKGAAIRHGLHVADLDETCRLFNHIIPRGEELGIKILPIVAFPSAETARMAWERTKGRIGYESFYHQFAVGRCGEPWDFLNIAHHGELSPCCGGPEGQKVSEPFKKNGQDLLNVKANVLLRALTRAGYTPTVCKFYCRKCYS